jgi:translation initiation factor 1A
MPKKKSKHKKPSESVTRALVFKEPGQEYCKVTKMLGDARLQGICSDGKERICKIRGSMSKRRKVWIKPDDYVLISLRDFQDDKADVIWKYEKSEVKALIKYGEIESNKTDEEEDIGIDFGYNDEEDVVKELDFDNI